MGKYKAVMVYKLRYYWILCRSNVSVVLFVCLSCVYLCCLWCNKPLLNDHYNHTLKLHAIWIGDWWRRASVLCAPRWLGDRPTNGWLGDSPVENLAPEMPRVSSFGDLWSDLRKYRQVLCSDYSTTIRLLFDSRSMGIGLLIKGH